MTSEHVTITEEVQTKDGLVTQERETLQYTPDPSAAAQGNPAMSVLHPDYVPASERVYVYNEATGMSESTPAQPFVIAAFEREDEDDEEPIDEGEDDADVCGHPVGNGSCALEEGHSGAHRLTA